jgi:hypothetical protein
MLNIKWTETNPGGFTGVTGTDEAGNKFSMPADRETCTCTMPDGSTGHGWTPEEALERAEAQKAEIELPDAKSVLVGRIAEYLIGEDFPIAHLEAILIIITRFNWSDKTEASVFEFAKTLEKEFLI